MIDTPSSQCSFINLFSCNMGFYMRSVVFFLFQKRWFWFVNLLFSSNYQAKSKCNMRLISHCAPHTHTLSVQSVCAAPRFAPAVTAPQRQRRQRRWRQQQRTRQTWTSATPRRGRWAPTGDPGRTPQTPLSSPATAPLLASAHRRSKKDNNPLKTFRLSVITHQLIVLHDSTWSISLALCSPLKTLQHCLCFVVLFTDTRNQGVLAQTVFRLVQNVNIRDGRQMKCYFLVKCVYAGTSSCLFSQFVSL